MPVLTPRRDVALGRSASWRRSPWRSTAQMVATQTRSLQRHQEYRLTKYAEASYISDMTEITEKIDALPGPVSDFILHWGDMGGQWGVNRSVAQIHAFLYLSEKPLTAEDIAEALGMARSNVSNSVKELLGWKLIKRVPVAGDRRDHFIAETDVWVMVQRIAEGRKQREIDPAAATLADTIARARNDPSVNAVAFERLTALFEFITTVNRFYDQMLQLPRSTLMTMLKMGNGLARFIPRRG
jgi:DNA-binding transcriptional regulator GbsR (MarR family)